MVTDFAAKLRRLEPVNLAAIAEHAEAAQRKEYLDAQGADLTTALDTLEDAIRKIDRETRGRFKDTFDRVNSGVQQIYPRLFGGGHARSEEHTSELQSLMSTSYAAFCLKKNNNTLYKINTILKEQ